MTANTVPGKLAHIDFDQVIARIAAGEQQKAIAAELGVTLAAISYHVCKREDYTQIVTAHHQARLDEGHELLDKSVDSRDFDLARARGEQLKRREWRAERESERWQQKKQVAHTGEITIEHKLTLDAGRILDVMDGDLGVSLGVSGIDGERKSLNNQGDTS